MPKPRRWIPWAIAGGGSPAWTSRLRGDGSIGSARSTTATACCWHGRAPAGMRILRIGESLRCCRSAGARGIAEGPVLGQVLALAEDAWLAADFPLDEGALKTIADQAVARFTRDNRPCIS